eukprot:3222257-Rhodomonas_salina.2
MQVFVEEVRGAYHATCALVAQPAPEDEGVQVGVEQQPLPQHLDALNQTIDSSNSTTQKAATACVGEAPYARMKQIRRTVSQLRSSRRPSSPGDVGPCSISRIAIA